MKSGRDEKLLSAYMDGELAPDAIAEVEDVLEKNSDARQYILDAVNINARMRGSLNIVLTEEIPQRLVHTVDPEVLQSRKPRPVARHSLRIAAALVLVLLGLAIGNLLPRSGGSTLLTRLDGMPAELTSVVADVLENHVSGSPRQWRTNDDFIPLTVTPVKTYRDSRGRYFREYTLEFSHRNQQRRIIGLAYRTSAGRWKTKALFFDENDNSV